MNQRVSCMLALVLLLAGAAAAAPSFKSNPDLKPVLDALRKPVAKDLKQPVVFKIDHFRSADGWAFLTAVPMRPGSKKVDYRRTRYAPLIEIGTFDDWICALLRKRRGVWKVVRYRIGATDVAWEGWDREYKAPCAIFPYAR